MTEQRKERRSDGARAERPRPEARRDVPPTAVERRAREREGPREAIFGIDGVGVSYSGNPAVRDITFDIDMNEITALIGPSGCGKSTLIRCLNRMNDLIPGAEVTGTLTYHGQDLYASTVDAVEVRKRIGMVFQKPNPFPKSIYDNIAFGPRVLGMKGDMDEIVESRAAARRAVGRGQGPAQDQRLRHVRRPAAAPLHRPGAGHRPRRDPDGRAVLGARPDLDGQDRGPDARAARELLDRDRHAQHAAGRARVRHDGVLHRRAGRGRQRSAPAAWSSTTTPRRSSPTRATSARRPTSPARSADGRTPPGAQFQEELEELERQALGGLDMVEQALGARDRDGRAAATSSWRAW